jgi:hypothetical protein
MPAYMPDDKVPDVEHQAENVEQAVRRFHIDHVWILDQVDQMSPAGERLPHMILDE